MPEPWTVILSPYDVSARSPAAMAALILADRVVTLLPAPFEGTGSTARAGAAEDSPRYVRFMESWRWTSALWRDPAVLAASHHGESPLDEVRAVARLVESQPEFAPLRAVLKAEFFTEGREYLDAVSRDLLGGGDPGVALPIRAGLERFAARHALPLVRGEAKSVTDRLGRTLQHTGAKVEVPIIMGADAGFMIRSRAAMAAPLGVLREGLSRACQEPEAGRAHRAEAAAALYSTAFRSAWPKLASHPDPGDRTPTVAHVSVMLGKSPSDATLRAAAAAARSLPVARPAAPSRTPGLPAAVLNLGPLAVIEIRVRPWDFQ